MSAKGLATRIKMREKIRALNAADFWTRAKHDATFLGERERFFFLNEIMWLYLTGHEENARNFADFLHGLAESKKHARIAEANARIAHGRISRSRNSS